MARYQDWQHADSTDLADVVLRGSGRNNIQGTSGDDRLVGTDGGDNFHLEEGGDDIARGGAGNDHYYFRNSFDSADTVIGGTGSDSVSVSIDTLDARLGTENFRGIEALKLGGNHISLVLIDGLADLRINASGVSYFRIDASDVTTGSIRLLGGIGGDIVIGSSGADTFFGSSGADVFTGGDGKDRYFYSSEFDSTSNFNFGVDKITDFSGRDTIFLHMFNVSSYHIGQTADRIGDVLLSYDEPTDITTVSIFTDSDKSVDMSLYLSGLHLDLQVSDSNHLIVG